MLQLKYILNNIFTVKSLNETGNGFMKFQIGNSGLVANALPPPPHKKLSDFTKKYNQLDEDEEILKFITEFQNDDQEFDINKDSGRSEKCVANHKQIDEHKNSEMSAHDIQNDKKNLSSGMFWFKITN